jgi:hypothetical protein
MASPAWFLIRVYISHPRRTEAASGRIPPLPYPLPPSTDLHDVPSDLMRVKIDPVFEHPTPEGENRGLRTTHETNKGSHHTPKHLLYPIPRLHPPTPRPKTTRRTKPPLRPNPLILTLALLQVAHSLLSLQLLFVTALQLLPHPRRLPAGHLKLYRLSRPFPKQPLARVSLGWRSKGLP